MIEATSCGGVVIFRGKILLLYKNFKNKYEGWVLDLMMAGSYYSKPQKEEYFEDSGYYKYHEAYHMLKFANERQILEKAYEEYLDLKRQNLWGSRKYY